MQKKYPITAGFTLIEMIVSLGIFSIIITTAVGALLVLIATNQRLQGEQSAMTNISFALDSMTREIRTGYNYYCVGQPNYNASNAEAIFNDSDNKHEDLGVGTKNCGTGRGSGEGLQGISFYEGGDSISGVSNRIVYFYDNVAKTLKRKVGNNAPQSIISSGIQITDADFFVTGTNKLTSTDDFEQPTVTIYLKLKEVREDKDYYLQTTVTQRILDL